MIAHQLIKTIKSQRGPVFVEVTNFDDTFYIQVVKSDLLGQFAKFSENEETGFELSSKGFLFKDYTVAPR